MSQNTKLFSEMERYEIININDGEKYSTLGNNDILVDSYGNLKLLLLNDEGSRFGLFSRSDYKEIPWHYVRKIGARTIIMDIDEDMLK
ncbi:YlmC/YmxH family sporulation protein [Clostridium cellulovorans]|uniref:Sporulation protein, YlmC/YmxH family n=1 Tax=Clostridium cellulovorans (strain ATCC 35296 / DSM 3052 / OCM 3 / 743B) TaxID=573061 RepID=D9SL24_CLOC7|nr:YlmC/YmxH family sporulation protein [Clostridium cellulovorans]ADL51540.1 sporulation protein, YlmC/YmxH family [Clostridium cellulovorans 743B]